jgi:hypothetical protein
VLVPELLPVTTTVARARRRGQTASDRNALMDWLRVERVAQLGNRTGRALIQAETCRMNRGETAGAHKYESTRLETSFTSGKSHFENSFRENHL